VAKAAPPRNKPKAPNGVEEELGLVTPPSSGPPLWRVSDSIEDFYGNGEAVAHAVSTPEMSVEPFTPKIAQPAPAAPASGTRPAAPRPRRTPPQPDDWTYFEPSQPAIKALIRRLDEIAGSAA
jgi:hypothetical protein